MYRADLENICAPMKPEEVLQHLLELQEALGNSAWGTPEDLRAVTAGAKVMTAVLRLRVGKALLDDLVLSKQGILTPMVLHWDGLDELSREEILLAACLSERLQHYSWLEIDEWIRTIIQDSISARSKGTVTIGGVG